jgi:hypothetical protein
LVALSAYVGQALALPENLMLFAGMALGYCDRDPAINSLRTRRDPFATWGEMHGFAAS